ncbi:AAA family ATPase [Streptomyces sp. F63]|uniref:AAA domain-containing protein n=1 Tax=Streptomyces sp. F63 TaxID=2824887 RepID=UPI001B399663|nr:AAA domain-containing protein [Streptomyces sp. F63]MBQ0986000.1 AAA family ATPase [Streptomyces sp. F63]
MGWREEIATALGEWIAAEGGAGRQARWLRVGRAVRTGEPGVHAVDMRGSDIGPDQLESLRLAGPEQHGVETDGFSVTETAQNGSLLTLRVAEFADLPEPYLWMLKQPPTFLVEALRDGIAKLGEAPLAAALAAGRVGGDIPPAARPPGFHDAQHEAYRACLGRGVHLVWGPPGTGKTTVLKRAIGDLIARGERVLLVSATNVAVDNALLGVVRERRHSPGDIVRVGPPQLREVADDPGVSLPLMVRERLAETTARRGGIETELVAIRSRAAQLAALGTELTGFDSAAYFAALKLLRTPGRDAASARARADDADRRLAEAVETLRWADTELEQKRSLVAAAEPSRREWQRVETLRQEQARLRKAAERRAAEALLAEDRCGELRAELREFEAKGAVARWRARDRQEELRQELTGAEQRAAHERGEAAAARATANARSEELKEQIADLVRGIPHTPDRITALDRELRAAEAAQRLARDQARSARQAAEGARQAAHRAEEAQTLADEAARKGWPKRHADAERLRPLVAADGKRRPALEKEFKKVQEEYERLARNAQGEIIKGAKLVATTLARFRTNKAVFEGPYDVVLVDEAGSATLPEVLLATAKASGTAVLLGDFMQLGAVVPPEIRDSDRPDVKRWLLPDVFEHCGITEPEQAARHPACVTLTEQHRFGPAVMRLANSLAYGGVLRGGARSAVPREPNDPEIVFVDTDGLHELARPHLTGRRKGWWPAGALLSRALVEYHREQGEEVGVVTPYGDQTAATLETLRDAEGGGGPLAEVGTAHRFQGREFPVVIFDMVEGAHGRPLWMGMAHRKPGAGPWVRNGVRLLNVAVTRTQTRLYILGSGERISRAEDGMALACLNAMVGTPGVRRLRAQHLITPPDTHGPHLGEFGSALAEVLSRHVEVTDVQDELAFYATFADRLRAARSSIWLWAPWVAQRVRAILPELREAVRRGVRVTVFIRDDTDQLQQRNPDLIADLRAVVDTVVPMNVMHQKIVVIDDRTVMLGSLNALSQSWTREVMVTMEGAHFARKLLEHEHAEVFARPPKCGRCGGRDIEIRRRKNATWYWRCYETHCKTDPKTGRSNAWNQDIRLSGGRPR